MHRSLRLFQRDAYKVRISLRLEDIRPPQMLTDYVLQMSVVVIDLLLGFVADPYVGTAQLPLSLTCSKCGGRCDRHCAYLGEDVRDRQGLVEAWCSDSSGYSAPS